MPRPNVYQLPTDATRSRQQLIPIGSLSKAQLKIFHHVAHQNPHLKVADTPLLELFAMAYCRSIAADKRNDAQAWDREVRIVMALGTKLRLTPASTMEPRSVGRRRNETPQSYYDEMKMRIKDDQ